MIESTRSSRSLDAYRDMDGFDVDEELRRYRIAVRMGFADVALKLMANIDESMTRGGPLPIAWLGPPCMRAKRDLAARVSEALERAKGVVAG